MLFYFILEGNKKQGYDMSYDKLNALVENVRAIELAMKIRLQGRRATDSEKEVLSRYSGFGGIKEVLNIGTNNPIDGRMAEPIERLQRLIAESGQPHQKWALRSRSRR